MVGSGRVPRACALAVVVRDLTVRHAERCCDGVGVKVLRGPALVGRRDLDGRLQHAEGWLLPRRHVQEGLQVKQRRPLHRRGALRAGARARRRPRAKHGRDGGAAARVNPTLLRSRRLASERAPALPRRRRRASNRARLSPRCCEDTRRFLLWGAARRTAVVWRNAKREEEGRGIGDEGIMSIFPKKTGQPRRKKNADAHSPGHETLFLERDLPHGAFYVGSCGIALNPSENPSTRRHPRLCLVAGSRGPAKIHSIRGLYLPPEEKFIRFFG